MRARDNPFATARVLQVRYRLRHDTWTSLLTRLARLDYRAAIVGPEGSGKTTLLEDLQPRLAEQGFTMKMLRLRAEQSSFPKAFLRAFVAGLGERDIILLDGAEQLGPLAWRRFRRCSRRAAGLIIASHRPGRLPTLLECVTTPELLEQIVTEILGGPMPELPRTPREFLRKHQGNLRDALRELYDLYAVRPVPTEV